MPDRLVVLGSAIGALAVVRSGRRLGMKVVVVDRERGIATRSRYARSVLLPRDAEPRDAEPRDAEPRDAEPRDALSTILSLAGPGTRSALVAASDAWLHFVRNHRAPLADAFSAIPHPRNEIIDICLSKTAFARWCDANAVASPRAVMTRPARTPQLVASGSGRDDGEEVPPFPVIVRPDRTIHDAAFRDSATAPLPKAVELSSREDLAALLTRFEQANVPAAVTESLLGRPIVQYSVPFARSAGATLMFVAEKLRPGSERCGVGSYLEARPVPHVEAVARRTVDALDCDGIGEVEILHDRETGESHVIEVNPRPWTQFALAPSLGFDFLGHVLKSPSAAGRRTQPDRRVRWIDFRTDLYTVFSRSEGMIRRGELGRLEYLRSLLRARSFAKFDWRDPWPALVDAAAFVSSRFRKSR